MKDLRIPWAMILEYALYFLCLYLIMHVGRGTPVAMRFWYYTSRAAQSSAHVIGRVGIYAEKSYWAAVEQARG
jgi:hypothetical protein